MTKNVELIVVEDVEEAPSCYYIVDALGRYVFAKTKTYQAAKTAFDLEYGKGKYNVRTTQLAARSGKNVTAR